jgi:phage protein D
MSDVRQPAYKVVYEGSDITEDISADVVSINYEDAEGDESDEMRVIVDDMFSKWKDSWRPNRGDRILLSFGYAGEGLVDFGSFEIDEVHYRGQPDVVEFKALSVGIDNDLWELKSRAFDNTTILEVAQQIATENSLELIYNINPVVGSTTSTATDRKTNPILELRHRRLYQHRERDVSFLNRIANRYGLKFSVKGKYLSYVLSYDLHSIPPIADCISSELYRPFYGLYEQSFETLFVDRTIDEIITAPRPEIKKYDLRDCQEKDAAGVDVTNYNPFGQEGIIYRLDSGQPLRDALALLLPQTTAYLDDLFHLEEKRNPNEFDKLKRRLKVYEEVDNLKHAEAIGMARLFDATTSAVEGDIEFEGNPSVQAGTNIQVRGLRWLDGKYHVIKSFHSITRAAGYTTRVDVKMVGLLSD